MGPYMRPIPVGASAAMVFSLIVAFMVTPWAAVRLLSARRGATTKDGQEDALHAALPRGDGPAAAPDAAALGLPVGVVVLLLGSCSLVYFQFVKVKMLPFDNKSEFQVIVDMPEGTTLEETARVTRELAEAVYRQPEVVEPPDLRRHRLSLQLQRAGAPLLPAPRGQRRRHPGEPAAEARPQPPEPRDRQSGPRGPRSDRAEVGRAASRWPRCRRDRRCSRPWWPRSTARHRGRRRSGSPARSRACSSRRTASSTSTGTSRTTSPSTASIVDQEKAALNGISEDDIARTLAVASAGQAAGLLHDDTSKEDVPIRVRLDRATARTSSASRT